MPWYRERVWQMGFGAVMVLVGAFLLYIATAGEPVRTGLMWISLGVVFLGLAVPLLTRFLEAQQEKKGERGEC